MITQELAQFVCFDGYMVQVMLLVSGDILQSLERPDNDGLLKELKGRCGDNLSYYGYEKTHNYIM